MAFSIVLGVLGLGVLSTLLYQFTVYALPAFVGLSVGFWAVNAGAGAIGGILVGLSAAIIVLAIGKVIFTSSQSPLTRGLVALIFAAPAGYAAYQLMLQLSQLGVSSGPWQQVFAGVSALAIGWTAIVRLTALPNK